MITTLPYLALLALQAPQISARPIAASPVPFDSTVAARPFTAVALDVESGGDIHVVGVESPVVHVRVTERGRRCDDCTVAITPIGRGYHVRTARTKARGKPADLKIDVEVPVQSDVSLSSIGGAVAVEGIDGTVTGKTEFGSLELRRLSGALSLETKRGDVTLRESYVRGRVHTLDGRVLLEDVAGTVEGTTARGRIVERRVQHVPAER